MNKPSMNRVVVSVLFVALAGGGCGQRDSVLWSTIKDDARTMPGDLWQDAKDVVSNDKHVAILLLGGGASGYFRADQDDGIKHHFEGQHAFGRDLTIGIGTAGNPVTHFAIAGGLYVQGVLAGNSETHEVARSLIEALSLTGLTTTGLKLIAQDDSPNGEKLAWPSGHTSSTVTFATVMNEYYGPWVGVPLFALSGLVMYERMETSEHWASDIIFGAAIGYTVGKTVATKYRPKIFDMEVMPFINPSGAAGVALVKQF